MGLTQGTEEQTESMASAYKEQILNLLDKVDNDDLVFFRQIFTMVKTHVAIRSERKDVHPEE